jgi:hypothetical protein
MVAHIYILSKYATAWHEVFCDLIESMCSSYLLLSSVFISLIPAFVQLLSHFQFPLSSQ